MIQAGFASGGGWTRLTPTVSLPLIVPSDAVKSGCSKASDDVLQAYLME